MTIRHEWKFGFIAELGRGAIGLTCLLLVIFAAGCGTSEPKDTRAADEATIRALDTQWAKAAADKNVDTAVSYYSDDASLLAPNAPIASDKQSIRMAWAGMLAPDTTLNWQASKVEVARSGDLAYVMGVYQQSMKDAQGKPATDTGKFVEVWKKQADGNWKTVQDIFNSDLPVVTAKPAPAPSPEKKRARHARAGKKKRHARSSGI